MVRSNAVQPRIVNAIIALQASRPTFAAVATAAGASLRSVSSTVADLAPRGILCRDPLRLGPACGLALGISVGWEFLRCALVDANGNLFHQRETANRVEAPLADLLASIREIASKVLASGLRDGDLGVPDQAGLPMLGVAVAWPWAVDPEGIPRGGVLHGAPWASALVLHKHIATALNGLFLDDGRSVSLSSVYADALEVAFDLGGSDRWLSSLESEAGAAVVLRLDRSVDGATVQLAPNRAARAAFLDARVVLGANGVAGSELGHVDACATLVDALDRERPDALAPLSPGWPCSCGRLGHLEALVGAKAYMRRLEASGYSLDPVASLRNQLAELGKHDRAAAHALLDVGRLLGHELQSALALIDPSSVVLTGSLAHELVGEGLARETLQRGAAPGYHMVIRSDAAGAFSDVRGAALALIRQHVYRNVNGLVSDSSTAGLARFFTEEDLGALEDAPLPSTARTSPSVGVAAIARDRRAESLPRDIFPGLAKGPGPDYLKTLATLLDSREREPILLHVDRQLEWMHAEHTAKRRTNSALHPDRAERDQIVKAMQIADAREINVAFLRALREISDGPLQLRLGLLEIPKQAATTEDLWLGADMPRQRGADRLRRSRLFVVCSEIVMSNVVLPGPNAVIANRSRPDKAVLQVLADIREADPDSQIIGVDLDGFDYDVGSLLGDHGVPFTLRLPGLLAQRGVPLGPMAMILPVNPDTKDVEINGHAARDLRGLRAGRTGEWLVARNTLVEDGDEDGKLVTRPVIAWVTGPLRVRPVPGKHAFSFEAHIVRIAEEKLAMRAAPLLVSVLGVKDLDDALDLAVATVSATDGHPRISEFLKQREAARVFAGDQRGRHLLDNDRATATAAFAAYQLDLALAPHAS